MTTSVLSLGILFTNFAANNKLLLFGFAKQVFINNKFDPSVSWFYFSIFVNLCISGSSLYWWRVKRVCLRCIKNDTRAFSNGKFSIVVMVNHIWYICWDDTFFISEISASISEISAGLPCSVYMFLSCSFPKTFQLDLLFRVLSSWYVSC